MSSSIASASMKLAKKNQPLASALGGAHQNNNQARSTIAPTTSLSKATGVSHLSNANGP